MAQKQTALKAAMNGEGDKLTEKQAKGALADAVSRITNLTKKADTSKEAMLATGGQVLNTAETQGSLFLSSMAEGFLGEEKLKVGGVDLRAPIGLAGVGYGLYQTISGKPGGEHALAVGNGVLGSCLASVGRQAGQALAEKRGKPAAQPKPAPSMQGQPTGPNLSGSSQVVGALPPGQPAQQVISYPRVNLIPQPVPQYSGPVREIHAHPGARTGPRARKDRRTARSGTGPAQHATGHPGQSGPAGRIGGGRGGVGLGRSSLM